jgi:outer membrane receptor protein involved in Fe transport
VGGNANKMLVDTSDFELRVGGDFRYDQADKVGVSHFESGKFLEEISNNEITEGSVGLFTEATWHATDNLRVMGAVRGDYYNFDVTALTATVLQARKPIPSCRPKWHWHTPLRTRLNSTAAGARAFIQTMRAV